MTSILLLSEENDYVEIRSAIGESSSNISASQKRVNVHLVGIDATGQDIWRTGLMRGNVGLGSDMRLTVRKCVRLGSDCRTRVRVVGTQWAIKRPSNTTIHPERHSLWAKFLYSTAHRRIVINGCQQSRGPESYSFSTPPSCNAAASTTIPPTSGPNAPHAQNPPPAQPADEIAALRARIAELECGSAHGNQLLARATVPHQALVADPTAVNRIRANLASAKDEPKKLTLPALQPGHKVYAVFICLAPALLECPVTLFASDPIPTKVEEAFKLYHYVLYTALTHDGLTAKGLDRSSELSIVTVDWVGAAKAAKERTLHYWGADRASALMSHHLVVLDIGQMHGCGNWPMQTTSTTSQDST
ncbi:uncharacterized protein EDB93DRAFT_1100370 [Suillus bovinus]|uniref:uncharacterized protein n=1 Tax=Suillus bovinus TaxID=48563 RepID=UPI001B86AD7A|nr:uncharacterized protein EDB93DRAFT_1100370 [Suillus bovinus]KAG2158742.1 hypothetical protein EDB93DRAFT_1100370 [Suillus bovinus]